MFNDIEAIANDYYDRLYEEYNKESEEEEKKECASSCGTMVEEDETFCKECERLLQDCVKNFLSNFNSDEREYIIEYISEMEV